MTILLVLIGLGAWTIVAAQARHQPVAASTDVATSSGAATTSTPAYRVWETNADGTPVRWDPCRPVELAVNPAGAYPGFERDLRVALATVATATGLELTRVADTTEVAGSERRLASSDGQRWAPVLVAFGPPGTGGLELRGHDRGIAVPVAVGPSGDRSFVTGQVVLNAERDDLSAGFQDRAYSWGATLLHELGHLVGLDHVDDPSELMATYPGSGAVRFGPGDLEGLAAVGAAGGCRTPPSPREVPGVWRPAGPAGGAPDGP